MALQHFYARVPARVSMYNRTDGFDTFACSEEITQEFAQKELGIVCEQKLTPADTEMIREGKLLPVYCRLQTKSGMAVQSCISYLPSDYTGERVSYMVHSLVFPTQEDESLLRDADSGALDANAFLKTTDGFSLTNAEASPNRAYPTLSYCPKFGENLDFVQQYDAGTFKRFLFALLLSFCGKLKSVYVVSSDASGAETQRLIEAVYHILPHYLRRRFTFVTRVGNTVQYLGAKLKGTLLAADGMQTVKCAVVDLQKKIVLGVREEEFAANRDCIEHFYAMLANEDLRKGYFDFCLHAVDRQENMGECSIKKIAESVFLFRAGCGLYDEKSVLPSDDKVLDMMLLYDTVREALPISFRVQMMHALDRYPATHKEIPKKIFSKITKMYPSEPEQTQQVLLQTALDLIHTDAMREKLLGFICMCYDGQTSQMQAEIVKHLCSVFYGGFLQTRILAFFEKIYPGNKQEVKDTILDKVLLVIRTKVLCAHLITFFDAVYADMNDDAHRKLYLTILEQLPEGDELAHRLLVFANRHLPSEAEQIRDEFFVRLFGLLEAEQRRNVHPMLALFDSIDSYIDRVTAEHILKKWNNRKIFDEYIATVMRGALSARVSAIKEMCAIIPKENQKEMQKLSDAVCVAFAQTNVQAGLGELLRAEENAREEQNPWIGKIITQALAPAIARTLTDVFCAQGTDGGAQLPTVEDLLAYGKNNSVIRESKQYGVLRVYRLFKEACAAGDVAKMVDLCGAFPQDARRREEIGTYAAADRELVANNSDAEIARVLLLSYLKNGGYRADLCYDSNRKMTDKGKPSFDADFVLVGRIFAVLFRIWSAEEASSEMKNTLTESEAGLRELVMSVCNAYGKRAARQLEQLFAELSNDEGYFVLYCRSLLPKGNVNGGLFHRLFGKK